MNNISRSIVFLICFSLFYFTLYKEINSPSDFVSPQTFESMTKVYKILSYPMGLWSLVISKGNIDAYSQWFHMSVPIFWLLVSSPILLNFTRRKYSKGKGKKSITGILQEYEDELTAERKKLGPQNKKESLLNKFGLLKLTSIEKMLFYRFSVLLPEEYQLTLRKQIKRMNRNQRFFLNDEKTIGVTVFDSYRFLLFKNTNIPKFNNNSNKHYEYVLISGMIKNADNVLISVDLLVENRIIKRIRFDAEYALDNIDGPFEIHDIRVSPSIMK